MLFRKEEKMYRYVLLSIPLFLNTLVAHADGYSVEQSLLYHYLVPTNGAVVVDGLVTQTDLSKVMLDSVIDYIGVFATYNPTDGTFVEFNPYMGKSTQLTDKLLLDSSLFLITDGNEVISLASVIQLEYTATMHGLNVTPKVRFMPQIPVSSEVGYYVTVGAELAWQASDDISLAIEPMIAYDTGVYGLEGGLSEHLTGTLSYQWTEQTVVTFESAVLHATTGETNSSFSMKLKTSF